MSNGKCICESRDREQDYSFDDKDCQGIHGLLKLLGLNYHFYCHPSETFPFAIKYLCTMQECYTCGKKVYKMKRCMIGDKKCYFCSKNCQKMAWNNRQR